MICFPFNIDLIQYNKKTYMCNGMNKKIVLFFFGILGNVVVVVVLKEIIWSSSQIVIWSDSKNNERKCQPNGSKIQINICYP